MKRVVRGGGGMIRMRVEGVKVRCLIGNAFLFFGRTRIVSANEYESLFVRESL
jgi:hypothetical protein